MSLDWWTLGLQTFNVVILVWLLARFLFKPVARIVAARQQEAGRLLDEAAASKAAAEGERQQAAQARAALAGLLVPIPFMALDLLTGAIQAYIFSVLAMVFIGAAVQGHAPPSQRKE